MGLSIWISAFDPLIQPLNLGDEDVRVCVSEELRKLLALYNPIYESFFLILNHCQNRIGCINIYLLNEKLLLYSKQLKRSIQLL